MDCLESKRGVILIPPDPGNGCKMGVPKNVLDGSASVSLVFSLSLSRFQDGKPATPSPDAQDNAKDIKGSLSEAED